MSDPRVRGESGGPVDGGGMGGGNDAPAARGGSGGGNDAPAASGGSGAPGGMTCEAVRETAGAFVLGALGAADDAAVRAHLASCTEPHPEIAELGGVLPVLAASVPTIEPPARLKTRLMSVAAADLAARAVAYRPPSTGVAAGMVPPTGVTEPPEGPVEAEPVPFPTPAERASRRRASIVSWALRIAAVVAIVALAGWNLLLRGQLDDAEAYQQAVAAVVDVAAQPGSLTAVLTPDGGKGNGIAAVSDSGVMNLAMQNLAPTSGGAVYEAWVVPSDGVPVPLGSFTVDGSGTGSLEAGTLPTEPGMLVALTLEPGPGATTPTLPIISKGVADKGG